MNELLHTHPKYQKLKEIPEDHVIVDKNDRDVLLHQRRVLYECITKIKKETSANCAFGSRRLSDETLDLIKRTMDEVERCARRAQSVK